MVTSMRILHLKDNTPRGALFDGTRAEFSNQPQTLRSPSKPGRVQYYTISMHVLLGVDGEPLIHLNVDWQPSALESFTCLSNTFVPQIHSPTCFARGVINLRADIELNYILFVALPEIEAVRDLPVGPNCPVVYKHVQPITVKKSDTRHAKPKDTNSTKVGNNNSGAKTMADAAETALSDTVCSKGDMSDVNVKNNKDVNLDNDDSDIDVIEDSNETTSFMAPKVSKVTSSSMGGGGVRSRAYMSVGRRLIMIVYMMMINAKI
ncbi:hypothetical protein Tco_1307239 [Tanacetum coccineum]